MENARWVAVLRQFVLPQRMRRYVFEDENVLLCSSVPTPRGEAARQLGTVETDAWGRVAHVSGAACVSGAAREAA
jgi:hypothetical protein